MKVILLIILLIFNTTALSDLVPTFPDRAVDTHNYQRNRLNNGIMGEQPIPNPFIKNMYWDQDIADNAQQHTDACIWEHSDRLDRDGAGENIAAGYGSIELAVIAWTNEEQNYNYETNSSDGVTGHYTQVVWYDSTRLGCGITNCSPIYNVNGSPMWFGDFITCQYKNPGNYYGQRPYSIKGNLTGAIPSYSGNTNEAVISFVELDDISYRAKLQMVTLESPFLFTITSLAKGNSGLYDVATFSSDTNILDIPVIEVDSIIYEVKMKYIGNGILELISIK